MLQYQCWLCWRPLMCKREWGQQTSEENVFGDYRQEVFKRLRRFSWKWTRCYSYFITTKNLLLTIFPRIYLLRWLNPRAALIFLARPCPYLILPWGPRRSRDLYKVQNVGSPPARPTFENQQRVFCILICFSACFRSMSVTRTRRGCWSLGQAVFAKQRQQSSGLHSPLVTWCQDKLGCPGKGAEPRWLRSHFSTVSYRCIWYWYGCPVNRLSGTIRSSLIAIFS